MTRLVMPDTSTRAGVDPAMERRRRPDIATPIPYRAGVVPTREPAGSTYPWVSIAVGATVSVLIRLRAFWTPVTSDEGGFVAIARAWSHGKVLYRDVWVDRPQGAILIFRIWDWLSGGSLASIRIMAMILGAALVVAVGTACTVLAGRTAGAVAAILVGVTAASPAIEGHIANGELLSAPFAVGTVLAACLALRRTDRQWLMVVSGVLGGCALSIKQSGFEGLAAVALWLIVAAIARWRTVRETATAMLRLVGGALIVVGALAVHGAATGFSRWWYAVGGYRLEQRSAIDGADWDRFFITARVARPTIWPLLAIGLVGIIALGVTWVLDRQAVEPRGFSDVPAGIGPGSMCLVALWPVAAAIAFVLGGQFHRHYWITLCPSLSALAAVLITRRLRARVATALVLFALIPTAVNTAKILVLTDRTFPTVASGDSRPTSTAELATWFRRTHLPGDRLYVMCASASFYADANEDPLIPYLWQDNIVKVPGALEALRTLLASPTDAPRFIAVFEPARLCDPDGQTASILAARYHHFTIVDGIQVLEVNSQPS